MNRALKLVLSGLGAIVVGISVSIFLNRVSEPDVGDATLPSASSPLQMESVSPTPSQGIVEPPHPVSLQAIADGDFDGRDFKVGRVLATTSDYVRYHITYRSGDLRISGIMNKPNGDGPFPVLILNHGYIDPAVYTNGRGLKREQDYLARRSYVVVHTDYRNHAQSDDDPDYELELRLGYIRDSANAVYALRSSSLPYVDAERVGMLGHSMGGGVTMGVLVTDPDLVDAAVLFAPVSSDYVDNFNKWTKGSTSRRRRASEIEKAYGSPTGNPEFWKHVSARTFFDRVSAPLMIHHGTSDASVPLQWSVDTRDALADAGKTVRLDVYEGEPHEFVAAWKTVMARTLAFFDSHVKGAP